MKRIRRASVDSFHAVTDDSQVQFSPILDAYDMCFDTSSVDHLPPHVALTACRLSNNRLDQQQGQSLTDA